MADASPLPVVETFHSLQGEGHHAGRSAFFIRLAGCTVGCTTGGNITSRAKGAGRGDKA